MPLTGYETKKIIISSTKMRKIRVGNSLMFSERITRFLQKNEGMSESLKKRAICSFLVSSLSESLMYAHFWWATWANRSWPLIFGEQPERFAHIANFWWADWVIHVPKITILVKFCSANRSSHFLWAKERFAQKKRAIHSFIISESLTVAHLSWATWAIRSR